VIFRRNASCAAALAALALLVTIPFAGAGRDVAAAQEAAAADFTLVDQDGQDFRLSDKRGHPVVLFFGYTHCPDVCPLTLANLAHARTSLGAAGRAAVIIFVTVDPARDTAPVLKRYLALFDPSFVGLTGRASRLEPVFKAYHVYHAIVRADNSAAGYSVTHSATVYFIARDGRIKAYGNWTDSRDTLTKELKEIAS
jgi:protein SCO1/2